MTQALGIQPTWSFVKDQEYPGKKWDPATRKTVPRVGRRPSGRWAISSKEAIKATSVEEHVQYILGLLEPKAQVIKYYLDRPEEYSVDIRVDWINRWTGDYNLSSATLQRMSRLCHFVAFGFVMGPSEP